MVYSGSEKKAQYVWKKLFFTVIKVRFGEKFGGGSEKSSEKKDH
jgi:hypothetical protein